MDQPTFNDSGAQDSNDLLCPYIEMPQCCAVFHVQARRRSSKTVKCLPLVQACYGQVSKYIEYYNMFDGASKNILDLEIQWLQFFLHVSGLDTYNTW